MKRGKYGQTEIPALCWSIGHGVEVESRHTCAVVASDPFPGAAVVTPSPRSRNFQVCLQQRRSDAHKSNPLLDVAATCHWHVKYELQNAEDPKHGYHWKVAAHSFLVNVSDKRLNRLLVSGQTVVTDSGLIDERRCFSFLNGEN